ncbi:hypothetical protein H4219_005694 [Mycoemilia scoparia]|uniref:Carboxypeptidase n=1 Tax=Mycoemilia scoparia TaxID=417184 RepID=A0A9W7ZS82_9FUNG|nr:hypothetical protein H4219_005694 [Mycoemilia scoparia]
MQTSKLTKLLVITTLITVTMFLVQLSNAISIPESIITHHNANNNMDGHDGEQQQRVKFPTGLPNPVNGLPMRPGQSPILEQYAGLIKIREWDTPEGKNVGHSSIFYWYFPAITTNNTRGRRGGGSKAQSSPHPPLLLWIQGGPGSTSMIGLFTEMGPLKVHKDGTLSRRNSTWANEYDILFVDQPVGTGFSYVHPAYKKDFFGPNQEKVDMDVNGRPKDDKHTSSSPGEEVDDGSKFNMTHIENVVRQVRMAAENMPEPWPKNLEPFKHLLSKRSDDPYDLKYSSIHSNNLRQIFLSPNLPAPTTVYSRQNTSSTFSSIWESIGLDPKDTSKDFINGYPTNMRAVGKDMHTFMLKFFELYPHLRSRDFYITSESYGGRFVPGIATYIDQENHKLASTDDKYINFKGMAVGNSWVDPLSQLPAHGTLGFYNGLLGMNEADTIDVLAFRAINLTIHNQLATATDARLDMFDYFRNVTGSINWYDIRRNNHQYNRKIMNDFLNSAATKRSLNVPDDVKSFKDPGVRHYLKEDIMRSSMPLYPHLIERYGVTLYQGQFDFRDGVVGNTAWINRLQWEGSDQFKAAKRQQWYLKDGVKDPNADDEDDFAERPFLAGYLQSGGNLNHYTVLNAGHMTPGDNPQACLDIIHKLTRY